MLGAQSTSAASRVRNVHTAAGLSVAWWPPQVSRKRRILHPRGVVLGQEPTRPLRRAMFAARFPSGHVEIAVERRKPAVQRGRDGRRPWALPAQPSLASTAAQAERVGSARIGPFVALHWPAHQDRRGASVASVAATAARVARPSAERRASTAAGGPRRSGPSISSRSTARRSTSVPCSRTVSMS